jgi:hypothetical protein
VQRFAPASDAQNDSPREREPRPRADVDARESEPVISLRSMEIARSFLYENVQFLHNIHLSIRSGERRGSWAAYGRRSALGARFARPARGPSAVAPAASCGLRWLKRRL